MWSYFHVLKQFNVLEAAWEYAERESNFSVETVSWQGRATKALTNNPRYMHTLF